MVLVGQVDPERLARVALVLIALPVVVVVADGVDSCVD